MPKVSVIIPTYNRSQFLCSAISSVLNQTFQDFEIIVVDDASTDNTAEVIRGLKDSRTQYIRHDVNKNGSAARNTGIQRSRGVYIAFLDDDDEWMSEKLEMQVELLDSSSSKIGCVYTGFLIIDRNGGKVLGRQTPSERGDIFGELVRGNCVGTTSTPLLRKECFQKVGLFDESLSSSQDYDMWIRVSKKFHFDFIEKPLVKYYQHDKRVTTNHHSKIAGIELILNKYVDLFATDRKRLSGLFLKLGVNYCRIGNTEKGRETFLKAMRLNRFEVRNYFNFALSLLGGSGYRRMKQIKDKLISPLRREGP